MACFFKIILGVAMGLGTAYFGLTVADVEFWLIALYGFAECLAGVFLAWKLISRQKAEIERLKKEVEVKSQKRANFFEIIDAHEKGRARAIKEFWDKAKQTREFRTCPYVYVTDGDNLVKEMTERKE